MAVQRRLCFLLVEKDEAGLSPRKLLIEATKHNVLTAYSPPEGLSTFRRFPDIDAVALDSRFGNRECASVADEMKKDDPQLKIVAFMSEDHHQCSWADYRVEKHNPKSLLDVLTRIGASTNIA